MSHGLFFEWDQLRVWSVATFATRKVEPKFKKWNFNVRLLRRRLLSCKWTFRLLFRLKSAQFSLSRLSVVSAARCTCFHSFSAEMCGRVKFWQQCCKHTENQERERERVLVTGAVIFFFSVMVVVVCDSPYCVSQFVTKVEEQEISDRRKVDDQHWEEFVWTEKWPPTCKKN